MVKTNCVKALAKTDGVVVGFNVRMGRGLSVTFELDTGVDAAKVAVTCDVAEVAVVCEVEATVAVFPTL